MEITKNRSRKFVK